MLVWSSAIEQGALCSALRTTKQNNNRESKHEL
jgi:hypothetical protein